MDIIAAQTAVRVAVIIVRCDAPVKVIPVTSPVVATRPSFIPNTISRHLDPFTQRTPVAWSYSPLYEDLFKL